MVFGKRHPISWVAATALCALSALWGTNAYADTAQTSALVIDGSPIDPACLLNFAFDDESSRQPVELKHCKPEDLVIKGDGAEPGMIGFEYEFRHASKNMYQPYFEYRYLGRYHGHALLFVENGSGTAGQFTQLISVDRVDKFLRPAGKIASGDRCDAGISNAALDGDKLSYDQTVSPYFLLALTRSRPKLDSTKDLDWGPSNCVATVHYRDKQWISLTLTQKDLQDQSGATDQFRYQACFNKLYRGYIAAGKTELDHNGVDQFAMDFTSSCLTGP